MICTMIGDKVKCWMNGEDNSVQNVSPLMLFLILVLVTVITVLVLQFAWNNSVCGIFNVREISFTDALGLIVVSMILFKM